VDGLVERLELGELAGRQVLVDDHDEVAVAELGGVADGEGALEVEAQEVVAQGGADAVQQVGEDGVQLGKGRGLARGSAVVFRMGHGKSRRGCVRARAQHRVRRALADRRRGLVGPPGLTASGDGFQSRGRSLRMGGEG
jgi:hypothetical protein